MSRREQLQQRVIAVVTEVLALTSDKVKPQSRFLEDLGATSLDIATLMMLLEDELDIRLPEQEVRQLATVSDIVEFLLRSDKPSEVS